MFNYKSSNFPDNLNPLRFARAHGQTSISPKSGLKLWKLSLMRGLAILLAGVLLCSRAASTEHPSITGIAYVKIQVSDFVKAKAFYSAVQVGLQPQDAEQPPCDWCERLPSSGATAIHLGVVKLAAIDTAQPAHLEEIGFTTSDVKRLRDFLRRKKVAVKELTKCGDDSCFATVDPEMHHITFVEPSHILSLGMPGAYVAISRLHEGLIHAGFVVHDRAAMEHFYKDILGFRPYWHGGMKDDQTDWLDLQVPDGTDWIEFMLNVPADADKKLLGIMNHIALGVPDIHAAAKQLLTNGMKLTEEPKIGRDGKWQLNLYDPDDTRVELMEFTPTQKPCCSEYTGPHPKP
jgi:catechol 2,3-dioxygenase-like lactoylglutathione lyase family enzyme